MSAYLGRPHGVANDVREVMTLKEFHDQIGPPVRQLVGIADPNDIRMVEPRSDLHLALKTEKHLLVMAHLGQEQFQGHPPLGAFVSRLPNLAHPTHADQADYAVNATYEHPRGQGPGSRWIGNPLRAQLFAG